MLKRRSPPLVLLLAPKHPRGTLPPHKLAPVSDQPTCSAAAPHVAASSIHPYPLSAHVPEVTMGYTVVCGPAILLQELLEASQKSPVVAASQSVVPHAQFAGSATLPSVVAHVGTALHRSLLDVSQKSPVTDVQAPEVPQTQGSVLAVIPWL